MPEEREPDIMGANDDALEKKVREMMDPVTPDDSKSKKIDNNLKDASTAPEVTGLPTPKEPLTIKIIKDKPEDSEPATAPLPKKTSKKKIDIKDETETPVANTEALPSAAVSEDASDQAKGTGSTVEEDITEQADSPVSSEVSVDEAAAAVNSESGEQATIEEPNTDSVDVEPEAARFEDDKTAKAVDDIMAHEGDELLAADEEKIADAFKPPTKPTLSKKFRHFLSAWWRNPKARWLTLSCLVVVFIAAASVPTSRYFLLNTAGIRGSLSLQVLDESTGQPLKNVKVNVAGANGLSDTEGRVKLTKVKLGSSNLIVDKRAFAPIRQTLTIGWGSNPLGEIKLTPTGTQYLVNVTDYLSGTAVENVEASSGEASALSDDNGEIKLTMDQPPDTVEISVKGKDYREEKLKFDADVKTTQTVKLVPARQSVYISKRSGKYDIYKIYVDGKDEQKILDGTGAERDDMVLLPHPNEEIVALVSTRDNKRNQDGFLLSTLTIIDLSDKSTSSATQSEQVRMLDWIGDRLIYIQTAQGTSAADAKRQRLMSYDYKTNDNKELISSNYFNDVGVIGNNIYFAPSAAYQSSDSVGLFKLDADGTNRQTIINKEVWSFLRTSFEQLSLAVDKEWYEYRLGSKVPTKLPGQPGNLSSRVYIDGPDDKKSLWVDNRDGKGVLLAYEPSTQNEQVLRTQSGLKNPVRWLSNSVVIYRINTEQETADYALSLKGGEPKKIRDVTHTSGTDNWYYY